MTAAGMAVATDHHGGSTMSITRSVFVACLLSGAAIGCRATTTLAPAAGAPGGAAGVSMNTTGAVGDDAIASAGGPAGTNDVPSDGGVDAFGEP
jgi:hypothetical protein